MLTNHTNGTAEDLFSCHSPSVTGYRYFAVLWGCAVTIIGTAGNAMTVLAFALDRRLRTRFNVLVVNLAVADLLYCAVLQPISVDSYLHLRWRSGQLWCQVFGLLLFLSNSVSIVTLCLVAVGRYLMVAKRAAFVRVFSDCGLALLLLSTWSLGLASFGPLWHAFTFVPQVCTCSFHRTRGRPYSTILLFFYFFVGLGCVGAFYLLIYRRVLEAKGTMLRYRPSRSSSRSKAAPSTTVESGTDNTCSSEISSHAEPAQVRAEVSSKSKPYPDRASDVPAGPGSPPAAAIAAPSPRAPGDDDEFRRVTRMCFVVFLCFVCCFVPFLVLNIADKRGRAPQVLHMFCANLTWLNSCINPVLYAVMNRQFRQGYQLLLTRAAAPFTGLRASWHIS